MNTMTPIMFAERKVNIDRLKTGFRYNEDAREIVEKLAEDETKPTETSTEPKTSITTMVGMETEVDGLAERLGRPRKSVVDALKKLERHNVGRYIPGRHGHQSRFKWFYTPQSIRETTLATDPTAQLSPITEEANNTLQPPSDESADLTIVPKKPIESVTPMPVKRPIPEGSVLHRFMLRQAYKVDIVLPFDLTDEEVNRLIKWIGLLPTVSKTA